MTGARPLLVALALALALAACGQQSQNRAPEGSSPGTVEDAAPPALPAPGKGYLKLRKIYDYVGDRAGTPWAPFEENGEYNYPEAIFGGWPVFVTPVDASGTPIGPTEEVRTLQELSPTDGRYIERPAGRYRLEERLPSPTFGSGVWSVTGANSSLGDTTTAAGAVTSQIVTVVAGETTVARFFNVCRVNGQVQTFPEGARENVNNFEWACRPQSGRLDESFGQGGRALAAPGGRGAFAVPEVAPLPDGGIVGAGQENGPGGDAEFIVAFFGPNGEARRTTVTNFLIGRAEVDALLVLPDGKVLVAGRVDDGRTLDLVRLALARYNADGTPDESFGPGGRVVGAPVNLRNDEGFNGETEFMAIQPDGKVVVAEEGGTVARFSADGTLDTGFGSGGRTSLGYTGTALAVQPDGKVVVGGVDSFPRVGLVGRLDADGTFDPTFGSGGRAAAGVLPLAVAVQTDGRVVLAGGGVERRNADGSLDASFDSSASRGLGGREVVVQADGKVVTGSTSGGARVTRFNRDGTLDVGFGEGGQAPDSTGSIALQADGKVLVGSSAPTLRVSRFLP